MKPKPEFLVVYGSLHLHLRESIEYAEKQISETVANCPALVERISVVFDLIASRRQLKTGFAHQLGWAVLEYIDEHYPSIGARVVGITDDDSFRPGRDCVLNGRRNVDNVHQFLLKGDMSDVFPQS